MLRIILFSVGKDNVAVFSVAPLFNQKAPQGGCGHRRQHARLR